MGNFLQNIGVENRQEKPSVDSQFKVLVVDDHPNTANMLARAISRLGSHVEVVSATSGLEAIKHVEEGVADILITDMMMPEMTGIELIEKLNDNPAFSPGVTYLLTAHDSAAVREIARRLNVRQVIAKPVSPEWICELISQTMDELMQSISVAPEPAFQQECKTDQGTEPRQEIIVVAQLLWEVAKKYQSHADLKGQLLVVGKTEPNLTVRGNVAQLRQALRNLVWIAIKNTPKGGTVILSSKNGADRVKIVVSDTGYRDDENTDAESYEQDLEVVKSIAQKHGGDVVVESEFGKGSCFTFILPTMHTQLADIVGQNTMIKPSWS